MRLILTFSMMICVSPVVFGQTMFEGYSKIFAGENHIGYVIQRYSYDKAKKQFKSIYFIRTNPKVADNTESLVAVADASFKPISYQYTSKTGATIKTIDVTFGKGQLEATVSDGKKSQKVTRAFSPGETFLSTFLGYVILQKGIKVGKRYSYKAIAEEDLSVASGSIFLKQETTYNGQKALRVLNNFKGSQFISFMTPKAEVLGTHSPAQNIRTELVKDPSQATSNMPMEVNAITTLFGEVPIGKTNPLYPKLSVTTSKETNSKDKASQGKAQ